MDRQERNRPDGFGGREAVPDSAAFRSDPYGPRTLGATTDASATAPDADGFGRAPVQMQAAADGGETTTGVHAAAARGVESGGGALPHGDRIQDAFGHHDVSHVQAHVGGAAADASAAMGATAYATGDHVAFASSPDLHTAAHEAAHVVQQRAGVHLKGDVSRAGDPYERHADAVADAVVDGRPAAPILDRMTGGGGGRAVQQKSVVQALHGDLSAEVRPEIAAQNPAMAGKTVEQAAAGLGARDANFNPARKVELEVKLSAAILQNPGPAAGVVHEISRRMLAYFDSKVAAGLADADADLRALGKNFAGSDEKPNTVFFGRLADTVRELRGDIAARMRALLQGGGTLTQQIFAHHQFIDQIWDKKGGGDYAGNVVGKLRKLAEEAGQSFNQQLDPQAPKAFRKDAAGEERTEFAERGRFAPDDRESRVKDTFGNGNAVPTTGTAAGIAARDELGGGRQSAGLTGVAGNGLDGEHGGAQAHQRGVDRLTMDESNAFVQKARLVLDMPLAGGISGTTTDLLEVATTFGISGAQLHLYAVAVLGHLGSAGAHSFHEIAKAASFAGIPYQEGNYASFIPPAYLPFVQHLLAEYADVVNTAGGGKEQAA